MVTSGRANPFATRRPNTLYAKSTTQQYYSISNAIDEVVELRWWQNRRFSNEKLIKNFFTHVQTDRNGEADRQIQ